MQKGLTKLVVTIVGLAAVTSAEAQNVKVKGSIGIGTASPAGPLHIVASSEPPSGLPSGQNGLLLGSDGDVGAKWIQSYNGPIALNPAGNNVGIGTTSAGYPLDVNGVARIIGNAPPAYTGNLAAGLQFGVVGGSYRWIQSFETQPLAINPGGNNVGIGTPSPFARLTVSRPVANGLVTSDASNNAGLTVAGTDSLVRLQLAAGGAPYGYAGLIQASYDNGGASNGVENLLLQPLGGKVGIGSTAPRAQLDINGGSGAYSITARVGLADGSYVAFGTPTTEAEYLQIGAYGNVNNIDNKGRSLIIAGTSHVGIGTPTPSYLLHVNGAAAGISWTNLSAREFKQNITRVASNEYKEMLDNVMKMTLTRYEYRKEHGGDGQRKLGFIAEEMPREVLSKDAKGVDLYELLAYTLGALKAQQREIEDLKAQLDSARSNLR
jgi:hypothetical protein